MWVDAWQYQCCGDDFALGETVRWALVRADGGHLESLLGKDYPDWKTELRVVRRGAVLTLPGDP